MEIHSDSFAAGERIPGTFAFGIHDPDSHMAFGANRNPHLAWSGGPPDTKSYTVICHDIDVPTRPDDVNQEGRVVPADLPRTEFFHWVLIDVPASVHEIAEGSFPGGVVARGKDGTAPFGRHGRNDYTAWFAGDSDMEGDYLGYDGPCPPWNDSLVHHYHFVLYATDLERCPVEGAFTGPEVEEAVAGHVLAEARVVGTYTLNPALAG